MTARADSILGKLRPHFQGLPPYTPIEPPEVLAERLGLRPDQIVKLDGNENPYGPSPRALAALSNETSYHIYPDPSQHRLREALAEYVGLTPEYVVAGSGSDELIDLIVRLFVAPGEAVLDFPPTFGMYSFLAGVNDSRVISLARTADFGIDLPAALAASADAKVIFVASPNNPTGNPLPDDHLMALLATGLPVVVDEAYGEFAGRSYAGLVRRHENLIVLRTLSKWAGLAGLRVGYMIAAPALIEVALKAKQPYNVNVAAEAAALASLEDKATLMDHVAAMIEERDRLASRLGALEWLDVLPSQGNFILSKVRGLDAKAVADGLRRRGIMVRYFSTPALHDYIRVSVGRPEHTDAVIDGLEAVAAELAGKAGGNR
jgi:histidinol-phosphate aminotransferase